MEPNHVHIVPIHEVNDRGDLEHEARGRVLKGPQAPLGIQEGDEVQHVTQLLVPNPLFDTDPAPPWKV